MSAFAGGAGAMPVWKCPAFLNMALHSFHMSALLRGNRPAIDLYLTARETRQMERVWRMGNSMRRDAGEKEKKQTKTKTNKHKTRKRWLTLAVTCRSKRFRNMNDLTKSDGRTCFHVALIRIM